MKLLTSLSALLMVAGGSVLAKECRMPDLPPDVRVQLPPECRDPVRSERSERQKQDYANGRQGFIDLGNGTQVRIGGRIRAEVGLSR